MSLFSFLETGFYPVFFLNSTEYTWHR